MNNIEIIVPKGALGISQDDDLLDSIMRRIAVVHSQYDGEWAEKYGTDFENNIFMMHKYCWCESLQCTWCGGCTCNDSAWTYFKDGKEMDYPTWYNEFKNYAGPSATDLKLKYDTKKYKDHHNNWYETVKKRNRIYTSKHNPECDYCLAKGNFEKNGAEPQMGSPNFWYKPLNFKVWWYKYIGRDMKTNLDLTNEIIKSIINDCFTKKEKK